MSLVHSRDEAVSALRRVVDLKLNLARPAQIFLGTVTSTAFILILIDILSTATPSVGPLLQSNYGISEIVEVNSAQSESIIDWPETWPDGDGVITVTGNRTVPNPFGQSSDTRSTSRVLLERSVKPGSAVNVLAPRFRLTTDLGAISIENIIGFEATWASIMEVENPLAQAVLYGALSETYLLVPIEENFVTGPSQQHGLRAQQQFYQQALLDFVNIANNKKSVEDSLMSNINSSTAAIYFLDYTWDYRRIGDLPAFVVPPPSFLLDNRGVEYFVQYNGATQSSKVENVAFVVPREELIFATEGFYTYYRAACGVPSSYLDLGVCNVITPIWYSVVPSLLKTELSSLEQRAFKAVTGLKSLEENGFTGALATAIISILIAGFFTLIITPSLALSVPRLLKAKAFGNDVNGETVSGVLDSKRLGNISEIALPEYIEQEMEMMSREDAVDAIERLRALLASGDLQSTAGSNPIELATRFERAELLHNAYFHSVSFQKYVAALLIARFGYEASALGRDDAELMGTVEQLKRA